KYFITDLNETRCMTNPQDRQSDIPKNWMCDFCGDSIGRTRKILKRVCNEASEERTTASDD
ncbi:MAG: hypothetical protein ABSC53_15400, partial [Bacteroidota bacterium]